MILAAIKAFMEAWANSSDSCLSVLAWPRYPLRELRPRQESESVIVLTVCKWPFGYKCHASRPREPPTADVYGIREVLNLALPSGFHIINVVDVGKAVEIRMEVLR